MEELQAEIAALLAERTAILADNVRLQSDVDTLTVAVFQERERNRIRDDQEAMLRISYAGVLRERAKLIADADALAVPR